MADDAQETETDDPLLNELPPRWRAEGRALRDELGQAAADEILQATVKLIHAAHAELRSRKPSAKKMVQAAYVLSQREWPPKAEGE